MRVNETVKFLSIHAASALLPPNFGFIAPKDGGKDVFVHTTTIEKSGVPSIDDGDALGFVIKMTPADVGARQPICNSTK